MYSRLVNITSIDTGRNGKISNTNLFISQPTGILGEIPKFPQGLPIHELRRVLYKLGINATLP